MKTPLQVPGAPAAIGPYSQAQVLRMHGGNRMVFASGQIPLDPETGEIVGADIKAQTEQVMKNIAALLAGAGLDLSDVIKTTVFLADMADFAAMNEVYGVHFTDNRPARSTVAVAGLPRDVRVEIEVIAVGRDY